MGDRTWRRPCPAQPGKPVNFCLPSLLARVRPWGSWLLPTQGQGPALGQLSHPSQPSLATCSHLCPSPILSVPTAMARGGQDRKHGESSSRESRSPSGYLSPHRAAIHTVSHLDRGPRLPPPGLLGLPGSHVCISAAKGVLLRCKVSPCHFFVRDPPTDPHLTTSTSWL